MYTNKTKVWLVAIAASLVGLSACNNEDIARTAEPTNNSEYKIVEGTGERVTLEFSGEADLEAFNTQPEGARYAITTTPADPRKAPVINLDDEVGAGKAKTLLIRLVDKNAPDKITEIVVPKDKLLFEGALGLYTFKFNLDVNLQEGQSFESGEWYISGVYGATGTDPRVFEHNADKARLYTSDDSKIELPGVSLVIPWTRIFTRNSPSSDDSNTNIKTGVGPTAMSQLSPKLGRNFRLRLKPDGVLIRIRPVSNVIEDVLITGIRLRTQELVMGTHTYTKPTTVDVNDLTSGAYPQVSSVSEVAELDLERINAYQGQAAVAEGRILRKGDYGNIEMFAWGFPKPGVENDNSKRTGAWIVSQGFRTSRWNSTTQVVDNGTASGTIIDRDPKDVTFFDKYNPDAPAQGIQAQYVSERWGARNLYQLVQKQKFERGKVYLMLPRLESDLQITERYSHVQDPNDGKRYSVIEIHNPTLRNINLNDYGLARIAVTGYDDKTVPTLGLYNRGIPITGYNPAKYTNVNDGEMYAFPEMGSMFNNVDFYNDSEPFQNIENFARALVLPMTSKHSSATIGMTIQGSKTMVSNPSENGAPTYNILGSSNKGDYPARYVDYTTKLGGSTAYDVTGATPNILAPGQTMIILSNGYLDASKFTDLSSNKTANNIPTFFADIKKGIQTGFCKYVVAMNNAKDENAAPMNANAGVMTMGGYDIPLLLKRRPMPNGSTGFYYQLLDGMWMNGTLAWYLGLTPSKKTGDEYYNDQVAANKLFGIASQYIKAMNRNRSGEHAGLWEKRTPSELFNMPIVTNWSVGRMTCAQDYAVGQQDDFTSFGVRLFKDRTTSRDPKNYVVKWRAKQ